MSSTIDVSNPKITVEIVTGGVAVDGSMIFVDVITGILPGTPGPTGPAGPPGPEGTPGVNDVWTRTESDDRYVHILGSTMTGALAISTGSATSLVATGEIRTSTDVVLGRNPTMPMQAVPMQYADSLVAVRPYDLTFDYGTNVIPAGDVASVAIVRDIVIPDNFAGSSNTPPLTNGTVSAAVFTVKVNAAVIGTATVSTAGAIAWAFSAPGAPLPVAAGSRLSITGPTPANATLAGLVLTIATTWVP